MIRIFISLIILASIEQSLASTTHAGSCDPLKDKKEDTFAACGTYSNASKSGLGLENSKLDHLRGLRIDFTFSDLSMSHLNFANLRECIGENANLTGLRAKGLHLVGGNYTRANFTGANLEACEIRGVLAPFSNFTRANLKGCKFIRSYFIGSTWDDANLEGAEFIDSLGGPQSLR